LGTLQINKVSRNGKGTTDRIGRIVNKYNSSVVRRVLDWDVLVSGGGIRVSDVTRGEGV